MLFKAFLGFAFDFGTIRKGINLSPDCRAWGTAFYCGSRNGRGGLVTLVRATRVKTKSNDSLNTSYRCILEVAEMELREGVLIIASIHDQP